jgi:hypothetical protein
MSEITKPGSPADEAKAANEAANRQFNGDKPAPGAKLPEANDDVTKANHEANAEFNGSGEGAPSGNSVGGLRGPAD